MKKIECAFTSNIMRWTDASFPDAQTTKKDVYVITEANKEKRGKRERDKEREREAKFRETQSTKWLQKWERKCKRTHWKPQERKYNRAKKACCHVQICQIKQNCQRRKKNICRTIWSQKCLLNSNQLTWNAQNRRKLRSLQFWRKICWRKWGQFCKVMRQQLFLQLCKISYLLWNVPSCCGNWNLYLWLRIYKISGKKYNFPEW